MWSGKSEVRLRYVQKDCGYPTAGLTEPPNIGHKQAYQTRSVLMSGKLCLAGEKSGEYTDIKSGDWVMQICLERNHPVK